MLFFEDYFPGWSQGVSFRTAPTFKAGAVINGVTTFAASLTAPVSVSSLERVEIASANSGSDTKTDLTMVVANNGSPELNLASGGGTLLAPTNSSSGTTLGLLLFWGYAGGWAANAYIQSSARGTVSNGSLPQDMQLQSGGALLTLAYDTSHPTTLANPSSANSVTLNDGKGQLSAVTVAGGVTALTPGSTVSLDPTKANVFSLTPAQSETINMASVPAAGQYITIVVTASGTSSFTLTFGTSFKSTGTLTTGTVSGKVFTITFVSDGVNLNEISRTTAM